jgi:hypothetical protein
MDNVGSQIVSESSHVNKQIFPVGVAALQPMRPGCAATDRRQSDATDSANSIDSADFTDLLDVHSGNSSADSRSRARPGAGECGSGSSEN